MAHTIYENFVLENKIEDMLQTAVDMNAYITADYSLTENAGMKKIINVYTATGEVETLAMGEGNTEEITVSFSPVEYVVETTQGMFVYHDEEEMTDPLVVETGLRKMSANMTNDLTTKVIAELGKATLTQEVAWDFDGIVDAIAKLNVEDEAGLFLMISPAEKATVRKNLGEDLKYSEGFARTGYIGSVCGVPVIVSKAVPAGEGYLATKEAVTCFVKKGSEIEQERDANLRKNKVFARKVMLVALTDVTKVVKLTTQGASQPEVEPEVPETPDTPVTPEGSEGSEG